DSHPGFHPQGPKGMQGLIEPLMGVEDYDVFIGVYWKRIGGAISDGESGTEQEILRAYNSWSLRSRPTVMLYFNEQPYAAKSKEELEQWGRVLNFRQSFAEGGLWWSYKGRQQFRRMAQQHLADLVLHGLPRERSSAS